MPLTTSPLARPRVDSFDLATRCLFHWLPDDLGLATIRGDQTPTFSRAEPATARGATGGLRRPIVGVERWHMYDLDGDGFYESPALLLERTRANSGTAPEDLTNGAYVLGNLTIGANAGVAPNNAATADKLQENTSNATHLIRQDLTGASDNQPQGFAIFVKAVERTWVSIESVNKANASAASWFNLGTGVLGTVAGTHTARIEKWGKGWYRISVVLSTVSSGGTTPRFALRVATGDNVSSYTGTSGSGVLAWGWHVEVNKSIVGTYAPVTTADETLTWAYDGLPQPSTLYTSHIELGTIIENVGLLDVGGSAGSNPRLTLGASGGFYRAILHNGTTSVTCTLAAAPAVGDRVELRAILASASIDDRQVTVQLGQTINGGAESLTAVSAAIDLPSAWAGALITANQLTGGARGLTALRGVKLYRGAQSLATMQTHL